MRDKVVHGNAQAVCAMLVQLVTRTNKRRDNVMYGHPQTDSVCDARADTRTNKRGDKVINTNAQTDRADLDTWTDKRIRRQS